MKAATRKESKTSRDPRSVQETHAASDRIRTEQQEVRGHFRFRADEAAGGDRAALSRLSEAECRTGLLLEEHRKQILSEARSHVIMQESRP